jgi:FG-GAP repeat
MAMRRAALLVLLALVAVVIPASPGWAQSSQPTAAPAAVEVRADFNHDGADDLAIGAPFERVGGLFAAGAAHVLHGSASGLTGTGSQVWTQDSPGVPDTAESGDTFGVALASGDFDHDGFADLAVAAPLESVGGVTLAGAVSILPGSASGLTTVGGRLFTQVGGAPETHDGWGAPLAAGDFNGNGVTDLAVSAPSEDVGSIVDAGAVSVLYGAAGGLTTTGGRLFTKDSPGIGGSASERDQFGHALTTGDTG